MIWQWAYFSWEFVVFVFVGFVTMFWSGLVCDVGRVFGSLRFGWRCVLL